jgi:RNA polymerase sigma-70 factor (ECF subfamily)
MSHGVAGVLEEEALPGSDLAGPASPPVEEIISRVLAGDHAAFAELMALTERRVLRVAWRLLGDRDQARDAAQDVFLRVYRSLGGFRRGENFQAWVNRITVNVCCDHARKRGPAMVSAAALEAWHPALAAAEPAPEAVLREERRALVQRALAGLTPAERAAIVLRDLEGLSTDSVAQALGVRPATVRSQICSARVKIQIFCAALVGGRP